MENNKATIETRSILLENDTLVTIHYEKGGETLEDKMAEILAVHISGRSES